MIMHKPDKICRSGGCGRLAMKGSSYCKQHNKGESQYIREEWKSKFYGSRRWIETSARYRRKYPLCQDCQKENRVTKAKMVHHNPSLKVLLDKGLDPCDYRYLTGLCNDCHRLRHSGQRRKKEVSSVKNGWGVPEGLREFI